ncbi:MAG TPA: hypothetical protein VFK80_04665 [Limnochordia bacterium]|nr:hypothetical protein [Limnochordia bacterium]
MPDPALNEIHRVLSVLPTPVRGRLEAVTKGWRLQPFMWNAALEAIDIRDEFLSLLDDDPEAVDALCAACDTLNRSELSIAARRALAPKVEEHALRYEFLLDPNDTSFDPMLAAKRFLVRLAADDSLKTELEPRPDGVAINVIFRADCDENFARILDFLRLSEAFARKGEDLYRGRRI